MTTSTSLSALRAELAEQVRSWTQLALAPHSSGAVAFIVRDTTIGILRRNGRLDVAVPAPIRAVLVEEDMALPTVDDRGVEGVAGMLEGTEDVSAAVRLLRLAYLYRRLLHSESPAVLRRIRIEVDAFDLPDALQDVYGTMLDKRPAAVPRGARRPTAADADQLAEAQQGSAPAHN